MKILEHSIVRNIDTPGPGVITSVNPATEAEIVPALGAGNTLIFKPASATILTGLCLGDMARRAGLPPGVFNTVAGLGRRWPGWLSKGL